MAFATLLTVIGGDSGTRGALMASFQLGARFGAKLDVLHVSPDPTDTVPLIAEGMSGGIVERVIDDFQKAANDRAKSARVLYEEVCASHDEPVSTASTSLAPGRFEARWVQVVAQEDVAVSQAALLKDLVIVERPDEETDGAYAPALEAALFQAGRPVLCVPQGHGGEIGKKIVIGWSCTRECARAISQALPLLVTADAVTVLVLEEDEGAATDLTEVKDYLTLHGVEARTCHRPKGEAIGVSLLNEACALDADLLVMGAYGHSRLREFILGGATRSVLTSAAIPLFLAH